MKRLILFLVILGFPYNASANPINTGAEILTSITVSEQTLFDIGQFSAGVSGGGVNFDTGEIISSVTEITLVSGDGVVQWVNASAPALATIAVTVASTGATPSSGVKTLVIVSHCRGPGKVLGADNGNCPLSSNEVIDDDATMGDKTPQ